MLLLCGVVLLSVATLLGFVQERPQACSLTGAHSLRIIRMSLRRQEA